MALCHFPDTIELVKTNKNGYGDDVIEERHTVSASFAQTTGWSESSHQNAISSDAIVYIDHKDSWVQDNAYRLEEFKVIANPFGAGEHLSWYKISTVSAPKKLLTSNELDHCFARLDKTVEITEVIS